MQSSSQSVRRQERLSFPGISSSFRGEKSIVKAHFPQGSEKAEHRVHRLAASLGMNLPSTTCQQPLGAGGRRPPTPAQVGTRQSQCEPAEGAAAHLSSHSALKSPWKQRTRPAEGTEATHAPDHMRWGAGGCATRGCTRTRVHEQRKRVPARGAVSVLPRHAGASQGKWRGSQWPRWVNKEVTVCQESQWEGQSSERTAVCYRRTVVASQNRQVKV